MERPSNLIIAFLLAIAGVFFAFALGRIVLFAIPDPEPEVEVEPDIESRELNEFFAGIYYVEKP